MCIIHKKKTFCFCFSQLWKIMKIYQSVILEWRCLGEWAGNLAKEWENIASMALSLPYFACHY